MSGEFQAGFGQVLKSAREAQGLSIGDVSAKLRLSARQIEAIEAEDSAHLPEGIYLRGFVRNYARLVAVDADRLVGPIEVQVDVAASVSPRNEDVRLVAGGVKRWVMVPVLVLAVFVLLVGLLYEWLRRGEGQTGNPSGAWQSVPEAMPSLPAIPMPAPSIPEAVSVPGSIAAAIGAQPSILPVIPPSAVPTEPSAAVVGVASVQPPPSVAQPSVPPSVQERPASRSGSEHNLRFEVGQAAWISIVDARGQRFSKLVPTGGHESFKGEPPFKLVVGEAAQVRMSYDGHVVDLSPYIGQKVARLTLE